VTACKGEVNATDGQASPHCANRQMQITATRPHHAAMLTTNQQRLASVEGMHHHRGDRRGTRSGAL
jgi:hypothetical protein